MIAYAYYDMANMAYTRISFRYAGDSRLEVSWCLSDFKF